MPFNSHWCNMNRCLLQAEWRVGMESAHLFSNTQPSVIVTLTVNLTECSINHKTRLKTYMWRIFLVRLVQEETVSVGGIIFPQPRYREVWGKSFCLLAFGAEKWLHLLFCCCCHCCCYHSWFQSSGYWGFQVSWRILRSPVLEWDCWGPGSDEIGSQPSPVCKQPLRHCWTSYTVLYKPV